MRRSLVDDRRAGTTRWTDDAGRPGTTPGDRRRWGPTTPGPTTPADDATAYRPCHSGGRFSANARTPSRKSSEEKQERRSSISCCSTSGESSTWASSTSRMTRLLPSWASGALPAISLAQPQRVGGQIVSVDDRVDEAPHEGRPGVDPAAAEEQLTRAGDTDRVDELADAGVRVDQPELGGWHPERDGRGRHPQVAGDRELEPAADRVTVQRGECWVRVGLDRLDRLCERVGNEPLGLFGEQRVAQVADVVAGGERPALAGDRARSGRRAWASATRARRGSHGQAHPACPDWRWSGA